MLKLGAPGGCRKFLLSFVQINTARLQLSAGPVGLFLHQLFYLMFRLDVYVESDFSWLVTSESFPVILLIRDQLLSELQELHLLSFLMSTGIRIFWVELNHISMMQNSPSRIGFLPGGSWEFLTKQPDFSSDFTHNYDEFGTKFYCSSHLCNFRAEYNFPSSGKRRNVCSEVVAWRALRYVDWSSV